MSRVIAIANQKGGVGKTTTTLNLGAALAEKGKRVLLVDLDQQGSLTISTGLNPDTLDNTLYNVVSSYISTNDTRRVALESVIQSLPTLGLELVPANLDLAAIDLELNNAYNREYILKRALQPIRANYDYVLLDCPPSLGLMVVNALAAADEVIIPLQAQYLATRGVKQLLRSIGVAREALNPELKVVGILLTMADTRTIHNRQIIDSTRTNFEGKVRVFEALVKVNVRLQEAPIAGQSILIYDSDSPAAAAYRQLAEEVENATA